MVGIDNFLIETEVGIYERKISRKKERKTLSTKKVRFKKNDNHQEKRRKGMKTQIRIKHFLDIFDFVDRKMTEITLCG